MNEGLFAFSFFLNKNKESDEKNAEREKGCFRTGKELMKPIRKK